MYIRIFTRKLMRDKLSFFLLVINYTFVLFVIYNAICLGMQMSIEEKALKPYKYQIRTQISCDGSEEIGDSTIDSLYDTLKKYEYCNSKLETYVPVGDGVATYAVTIYFDSCELCDKPDLKTDMGETKGVYIGEDIVADTYYENETMYIDICNTKYPVAGIYENCYAGDEDRRINIPWSVITEETREKLKDIIIEKLVYGMYLRVIIEDDNNIENEYEELSNEMMKMGLTCDMDLSEYDVSYQNFWYKTLNRIGTMGMLLFATVDCYAVTRLYTIRRKRELHVRYALGAGKGELILCVLSGILKHIICSIPIFLILEIVFNFFMR